MNSKLNALLKHTGTVLITGHASRLMLASSLIWFFGISVNVNAGEHNELHVAQQFAIDELYKSGCTRIKITRASRWAVEQENDYYIVKNFSIKVDCVSKKAVYSITWVAPTTRTDGTKLNPDDIAGYQILRDNKIIDLSPCCEYMTTNKKSLSIRAIDTDGLVSEPVVVM